jgi:hypothetical protein
VNSAIVAGFCPPTPAAQFERGCAPQSPVAQLVPSGLQPVRAKIPPLHHTAEGIVVLFQLTDAEATQNVALCDGGSFQLKGEGLFGSGRTK